MPSVRSRVLAAGIAVVAALAGCTSAGGKARPGVVAVVASLNVWGDVARQIGGDHVAVHSLIGDASADPHEFDPGARDAAAVSDARLVIVNGLGYDEFAHQLLATEARGRRTVLTVADVLDAHGDANPHLWYATDRLPVVADAIASALSRIDPADAPAFAANRRAFDATLAPLDAAIRGIAKRNAGAPVAYTERVPEYLLQSAGLDIVGPAGFARAIEDGTEPGARDTVAMQSLIRRHGIRVLLYNSQAESPATKQVRNDARAAGIPVVGMGETLPTDSRDLQSWQLGQVRALAAALGSTQ